MQHHHAHIASCLADNGEEGPVIGVAFDGTGYGTDATIWGGEFLLADLTDFGAGRASGRRADARRRGRDPPALADGGRLPGRGLPHRPARGLDVVTRNPEPWPTVLALGRRGVNSPLTSSAGRLFDAVAALLGLRDVINYEGQAAVELEQLARTGRHDPYRAGHHGRPPVHRGRTWTWSAPRPGTCWPGVPREIISARFHQGVATMIGEACTLLRERSGLGTVALSGGVFQNLLLLGTVVDLLEGMGFRVLTHSRVPPNDGGISLGQAVVAAAGIGRGGWPELVPLVARASCPGPVLERGRRVPARAEACRAGDCALME